MSLLEKEAPGSMNDRFLSDYNNKRLAIDTNIWIYHFLKNKIILRNKNGDQTNHILGLLQRTAKMLGFQITPLYILDGEPPQMKKDKAIAERALKRKEVERQISYYRAEEEDEDTSSVSTSSAPWKKHKHRQVEVPSLHAVDLPLLPPQPPLIKDIESNEYEYSYDAAKIKALEDKLIKPTSKHYKDCTTLFELLGVPYMLAPSEAEAQCVQLCKEDKADAVVSDDSDCIPLGAPLLLRQLNCDDKTPVKEFDAKNFLNELKLSSHDEFVDLCILCGCDYLDSIGMEAESALDLIREHNCIENILNANKCKIPKDWKYKEARKLFKNPCVDRDVNLSLRHLDELRLRHFLIAQNSFSEATVVNNVTKIKRGIEAQRTKRSIKSLFLKAREKQRVRDLGQQQESTQGHHQESTMSGTQGHQQESTISGTQGQQQESSMSGTQGQQQKSTF